MRRPSAIAAPTTKGCSWSRASRSACGGSASSTSRPATSRFTTKTDAIWIVFNGEIYNFRELRRTLEAAGHRFYTGTDTEVIVHAYEQWGAGAFARLRGMFCLALWDRDARTLLHRARSRRHQAAATTRPSNGRLYFGSEIKSLLCAPDLPRDLNLDALDHYLSFLYAPRDASFFAQHPQAAARDTC